MRVLNYSVFVAQLLRVFQTRVTIKAGVEPGSTRMGLDYAKVIWRQSDRSFARGGRNTVHSRLAE